MGNRLSGGMAPSALRSLLAFLLCFLAFSCAGAKAHLAVIEGNYRFDRGEHGKAAAAYLRAARASVSVETTAYDLANAYRASGENGAAFELMRKPQGSEDAGLRSDAFYNSGCLAFELARYDEAYQFFRKALEARPEDADAKVNLELSLMKMKKPAQSTHRSLNPSSEEKTRKKGEEIFNIIRNEESTRWKAAASIREDASFDDY